MKLQLSRAKWNGGWYYRASAKPEEKWRNPKTGQTSSRPHTKYTKEARLEPRLGNIYSGDNSHHLRIRKLNYTQPKK